MAKTYTPINWEAGTIVKQATVTIDNVEYEVNPVEVEGTTPVTAENLKHMDDAIKELYDEGTTSKDIVIGSEEEATEDTKLLIETDTLASLGTEVVNSLEGNETDRAPSVSTINNVNTYSTTEEKVIGTYVDGRPIYRKTFVGVSSSTAGLTRLITDVSTFLLDKGYMNTPGGIGHTFPYFDGTNYLYTNFDIATGVVSIDTSYTSRNYEVTLEYTKKSDTAISLSNEEVEEDEI